MADFGEDRLQKLVCMTFLDAKKCFFVLGTLKIGGGGRCQSPTEQKNLFSAKKWPFFGPFLTKNVKFWRRRAAEIGLYEVVCSWDVFSCIGHPQNRGGGRCQSITGQKKPIFGQKNGLFWPIFDEKCQILAKTGSRNWSACVCSAVRGCVVQGKHVCESTSGSLAWGYPKKKREGHTRGDQEKTVRDQMSTGTRASVR